MIATQKNPLSYKHVNRAGVHKFSCFASDIGLRAGKTPPVCIDTDMGNGCDFVLVGPRVDSEGDTRAWHYVQDFGCISLTIWND